jgi:hypothetical protein
VPVSLSVGEQECFNYLHLVDMPEMKLALQEAKLAQFKAQLEALGG